ncbi:MAG: hydroxymethylbilane synthase [Verrucomicrobia bacterium]|nr:hydroxymethylbilane synthase [Verrucomicrobiota bacterium]
MSSSGKLILRVGGRQSRLSRAQVFEVLSEIQAFHPHVEFEPVWLETTGDRDLATSLRNLEKTDFFTKEIDQKQVQGEFRISIHSAKDLPEPLASGLQIVALTKGVDSSDVIVLRKDHLPFGAKIGTSSVRREQNIKDLRSDLVCADIRGTIDSRLEQLDAGDYDGIVMAEAALIRLGLADRKRITLPGECAPLQGQLAVIARANDEEMAQLFSCIDTRGGYEKSLVSGNGSDAVCSPRAF